MTAADGETVAHGGDVDDARRQFPRAPQPWIDLSTGINPEPYPLPAFEAEAWTRLPQHAAEAALLRAAARSYGVPDTGMVVAGAGTQALLQLVPRLMQSTQVAVVGPTYAEHALAWRRAGHEVADIDDLAAARSARVIVVVNPNNPTGRTFLAPKLAALAQELAGRGGLLVVDEAFADFLPSEVSAIPELPPATLVLRSFGKAYGLAGVRLGFAIAQQRMAQRLREALGPWAVSGPALIIGARALDDRLWLARARKALEAAGTRLDRLLIGAGFNIEGATPLFRLTSHPQAAHMADALGLRGIHVRRFPECVTWLRFGLPGPESAWLRLEEALAVAPHDLAQR
jgi:cobalamin biosynthetic protein CobC